MTEIEYVDSHTGGEPTRTIINGGPDLGAGPIAGRLEVFRRDYDHIRSAIVNEPRGSDVIVGALLCPPDGVIFFNNVGYLGMCGHGAIGVIATLAYLRKIEPGVHTLVTPVGQITATLHEDGSVGITNVPSYRQAKAVTVEVDGLGPVTGDIAWGGNWFFLVDNHGQRIELDNVERLTDVAWRIRQALNATGSPVDHIELFDGNRNFVLCPGKAYDRSPCGTGTSAKLACLAADGKLAPGEIWRQESIVGSVFEGTYVTEGAYIRPSITGRAWISAHGKLILDPADPFVHGIRT
ncbi:MAG: proline racemase family protein [Acidobacteria bacterium]|nr:proline racemase family protein [Acidobacteriota bacterium]